MFGDFSLHSSSVSGSREATTTFVTIIHAKNLSAITSHTRSADDICEDR
jgi:hypothetical protein